eukprot:TRINITY_DN5275_c0_g2_i3.p1 TRINITY_DN5275_c0_g2~~TRINITY_DN5275_c0_g2_i3.p1  ORF type:complete len:208 (-),score=13.90 TRINITY_DN5275_c0_g2_i3:84-707(-)
MDLNSRNAKSSYQMLKIFFIDFPIFFGSTRFRTKDRTNIGSSNQSTMSEYEDSGSKASMSLDSSLKALKLKNTSQNKVANRRGRKKGGIQTRKSSTQTRKVRLNWKRDHHVDFVKAVFEASKNPDYNYAVFIAKPKAIEHFMSRTTKIERSLIKSHLQQERKKVEKNFPKIFQLMKNSNQKKIILQFTRRKYLSNLQKLFVIREFKS